jgi:hypothetical protein
METKILTSEEEIDFSTMVKKFVTISIHQMVTNISGVALSYTFAQNVVLPIMPNTLTRVLQQSCCFGGETLVIVIKPVSVEITYFYDIFFIRVYRVRMLTLLLYQYRTSKVHSRVLLRRKGSKLIWQANPIHA